ncbi:DUF305 domain-containing protein [Limnobacter parvus]|uniref:DUF305 domain-containing protein n=1 Tax=Limnobacter parvus TaxID=2939690 RepID=A0ABT1XKY7_9BURK|nr:DUF305 domain-containing protein [Limnobacter parvus]MCR2746764.1 DUF305 domain-containing protein [Limnobacter parvus]
MQHPQAPKSPYPGKRALAITIVAIVALASGFFAFQNPKPVAQEKQVSQIDAGFARSMMLHHAQAIQMSMMMRNAASPEIQALAQSIILKQTREMGVMEGWLTAWKEPVMVDGAPMAWVENAKNVRHLDDQLYQAQCKADGGAMAGVATPEELAQLNLATGTDKEILFIKLMLAHHRAAIPMAWFANRNGESSLVKAMAASMVREQGMEIGWMQMKLQQIDKS